MNKSKYLAAVPLFGIALALTFTVPASPVSGVVAIPPAAFQPTEPGYLYLGSDCLNNGSYSWLYHAPVYLPQGATVTKVTLWYYDTANGPDATFSMIRQAFSGGTPQTMAYIPTAGYAGSGAWSDEGIDNAVIDNSQYSYQLSWLSPADSGIQFCGAIIYYNLPSRVSLPTVLRNFPSGLRGR